MNCPRGFNSVNQISQNIGDESKECDTCDNLTYSSGILTCKILLREMHRNIKDEYKSEKRY